MTGLVRILDTLLTAKVSPPLDAGAVDANAAVKAPGAASAAQRAANDVRLLSNAGLDRELGGVDSASARGAGLAAAAGGGLPASAVARLSFAAKIISGVLADLEVDVGPVRGRGPVWTPSQQPGGPMLAGSLAHTVSTSGLFYESHLAQFVQGQRTLAQMAQEPQAAWPAPGVVPGGRGATALQAVMAVVADASAASAKVELSQPPVASSAATAAAATAASVANAAPAALAAAPGSAPGGAAAQPPVAPGAPSASEPSPAEATPDALKMQAAYRWGDSPQTAAAMAERAAMRAVENKTGEGEKAAVARGAATAPSGGEVVHPQLLTTVHQQLDLLATAAFRWAGEAWPGVPMEWRIEEEDGRTAAGDESPDDAPRRWSTQISLQLPLLGTVDVRLSVAGADVRATVVSSSENSRARLAGDGRALAARFDAANLRLEQFQVAQGEGA